MENVEAGKSELTRYLAIGKLSLIFLINVSVEFDSILFKMDLVSMMIIKAKWVYQYGNLKYTRVRFSISGQLKR